MASNATDTSQPSNVRLFHSHVQQIFINARHVPGTVLSAGCTEATRKTRFPASGGQCGLLRDSKAPKGSYQFPSGDMIHRDLNQSLKSVRRMIEVSTRSSLVHWRVANGHTPGMRKLLI